MRGGTSTRRTPAHTHTHTLKQTTNTHTHRNDNDTMCITHVTRTHSHTHTHTHHTTPQHTTTQHTHKTHTHAHTTTTTTRKTSHLTRHNDPLTSRRRLACCTCCHKSCRHCHTQGTRSWDRSWDTACCSVPLRDLPWPPRLGGDAAHDTGHWSRPLKVTKG